jgi:hypothetical protein
LKYNVSTSFQKAFDKLAIGDMGGVEILRNAATLGDLDAVYGLGIIYDVGLGVERSAAKAREFWTEAASRSHTQSLISLADHFATGQGVASNLEKAIELFERAAALGDPAGYLKIAAIFGEGLFGVAVNSAKSAEYCGKAADLGDPNAMFHLARLYFSGQGVTRDRDKGFSLTERSAELGDVDGLFALAYMCEAGWEGYSQDTRRAQKLYRQASRLGHESAKDALKRFPPVLELGSIVASPGVVRMAQSLLPDVIQRHQSGNWGDIDPAAWDSNDRALAGGLPIRSVYETSKLPIVVDTDSRRSGSFIAILDEEPERMSLSEFANRARGLYELYKTFHKIFGYLEDRG